MKPHPLAALLEKHRLTLDEAPHPEWDFLVCGTVIYTVTDVAGKTIAQVTFDLMSKPQYFAPKGMQARRGTARYDALDDLVDILAKRKLE